MSQTTSDKITINNSYTRLNTKGKYCDKDIIIVLENAQNLIPSNIKENVTIAGVTGTLKPETTTSESECDVESINETISKIPASSYENDEIIYSIVDNAVYKNKDKEEWIKLDAPIVPIVENVMEESVGGYSPDDKVYDEATKSFYTLSNGEWKELKVPNLLSEYPSVTPTHSDQKISLTADQQKDYDGFSIIKVKGVDIPTVDDYTKVPQNSGADLDNRLVYCDGKIYKLKAKSGDDLNGDDLNSVIYYNTELYNKDEIATSAELVFKKDVTESYTIEKLFKDFAGDDKQINFGENVLSKNSTVKITVNTGIDGSVNVGDLENVEPGFEIVEKEAKDIPGEDEYDYINKVKINPVTVVNWTNYAQKPQEPKNGEKYYLKPDETHPNGNQVSNGWTVGKTYQYHKPNEDENGVWLEVLPVKSYTSNVEITTNSGDAYNTIEMPSGYGMSEVKFKVNVPKGDPVPDKNHNTEEKAVEPSHDSFSITKDKSTDGFDTVWIKGVKVINVYTDPKQFTQEQLKGFENGELVNYDNKFYVYNGTEFVDYIITYEHTTHLSNGRQPIDIPSPQVASQIYVTVDASDYYDTDKTYNTTPVTLKHKSETLKPAFGTVGFENVTLPDVTILDVDDVKEDDDATSYNVGAYVNKKGTSNVFKVVEENGSKKFKNVVLETYNHSDNSANWLNPNQEIEIPVPNDYNGMKKIKVKARALNTVESDIITPKHLTSEENSFQTINTKEKTDGYSVIKVKNQNVINVDSPSAFYGLEEGKNPENLDLENNMFYLTTDSQIIDKFGYKADYPKGVYKYYDYNSKIPTGVSTINKFSFAAKEKWSLNTIMNIIGTTPPANQGLKFSTSITFINGEINDKKITAKITYKNCFFSIKDGYDIDGKNDWVDLWILKSTEKPEVNITYNPYDETPEDVESLIFEKVTGFSENGLEIKFLSKGYAMHDRVVKEIIWEAHNNIYYDTGSKKIKCDYTEQDLENYFLLDKTSISDTKSIFTPALEYNVNQISSPLVLFDTTEGTAKGWYKLVEQSDNYLEKYTLKETIKENGTFNIPSNSEENNFYFKQLEFTVEVPKTSIIKDFNSLSSEKTKDVKENDIINLTDNYTEEIGENPKTWYKGLYKKVKKELGGFDWQRLPNKMEEKDVKSEFFGQNIIPITDAERGIYTGYSNIYIPAYYIKTLSSKPYKDNEVNGPTYNEIKDTKTGKYYFMPKDEPKGKTFKVIIPHSDKNTTSQDWISGEVYQYDIDESNIITWKKVELVNNEEHICDIPSVDEKPTDLSNYKVGDRIFVKTDKKVYEAVEKSPDVPDLIWEELILESSLDIPTPKYKLITVTSNNKNVSASESGGPYGKVDIKVEIPEVKVICSPTKQENITIRPSDLTQTGKGYTYEWSNDYQNNATNTLENVLFSEIVIDTTGIKPDVKTYSKPVNEVKLGHKNITYDISKETGNYDGYSSFTVPGVTVLDMDALPDAEDYFELVDVKNKKVCVDGTIYTLVVEEKGDVRTYGWEESSHTLMKESPEFKYQWGQEITPGTFGSNADGFASLKLQNAIINEFDSKEKITLESNLTPEYKGKIAFYYDEELKENKFFICEVMKDGETCKWIPLQKSYANFKDNKEEIKIEAKEQFAPITLKKLSPFKEEKYYESIDLNKVKIDVHVPEFETKNDLQNSLPEMPVTYEKYYAYCKEDDSIYKSTPVYNGNTTNIIDYTWVKQANSELQEIKTVNQYAPESTYDVSDYEKIKVIFPYEPEGTFGASKEISKYTTQNKQTIINNIYSNLFENTNKTIKVLITFKNFANEIISREYRVSIPSIQTLKKIYSTGQTNIYVGDVYIKENNAYEYFMIDISNITSTQNISFTMTNDNGLIKKQFTNSELDIQSIEKIEYAFKN